MKPPPNQAYNGSPVVLHEKLSLADVSCGRVGGIVGVFLKNNF
jgi:hypothetical protein